MTNHCSEVSVTTVTVLSYFLWLPEGRNSPEIYRKQRKSDENRWNSASQQANLTTDEAPDL